jgi:hypothetical protein
MVDTMDKENSSQCIFSPAGEEKESNKEKNNNNQVTHSDPVNECLPEFKGQFSLFWSLNSELCAC